MNPTIGFSRKPYCRFAATAVAVFLAGCAPADKDRFENKTTAGTPTSSAPVALVGHTAGPAPASVEEVAPTNSVIRINAGADAAFTDSAGNVWLSDRGFEGGDIVVRPADMPIANTKDAGLYRTEHWGMESFSQRLPNGKYVVRLYFAETSPTIKGPGGRIFSFNVEGHEFRDFDVWVKAGGPRRAYIETVDVVIINGKLVITFEADADSAEINAIEISPAL